jgi:hypothetical protein
VRFPACIFLALGLSLTALTVGSKAHADTSAWMFAGAGALGVRPAKPCPSPPSPTDPKCEPASFTATSALTFDMGIGTTPDGPVIVGGLLRVQPLLGNWTDLAILARAATHGFQASAFGLAVDAGVFARFWGEKCAGFMGELTLGAPLGFQLSIQAMVGTKSTLGFGAVAGIDLLRLTLYRQTMLDHWQNPSPAWKRLAKALPLSF